MWLCTDPVFLRHCHWRVNRILRPPRQNLVNTTVHLRESGDFVWHSSVFYSIEVWYVALTAVLYALKACWYSASLTLSSFNHIDEVYVVYFKTNTRSVTHTPALLNYCREMYQMVAPTVMMDQIKQHYYTSHPNLNKYSIIPRGADFAKLLEQPHDRELLGSNKKQKTVDWWCDWYCSVLSIHCGLDELVQRVWNWIGSSSIRMAPKRT